VIIYFWNFTMVDYICRKLRGEGTLEKVTVNTIPEDLIKNSLVVGRIKSIVAMEG
jgi:hypothetical protein